MHWYVYMPFRLERHWEHLELVEDTAKWYSSEGLNGVHVNRSAFHKAWAEAQQAALKAGWDGAMVGKALVYWLPADQGFEHGFVWRQGNGKGVLVSPVALRHLKPRDRRQRSSAPQAPCVIS